MKFCNVNDPTSLEAHVSKAGNTADSDSERLDLAASLLIEAESLIL
jgi:hypothetical protein